MDITGARIFMLKKISLAIIFSFILVVIVVPVISYQHSLSLLESFPEKPKINTLSKTQIEDFWAHTEPELNATEIHNITPYWIYSWILSAILEENKIFEWKDKTESLLSHTCSEIAISHLRALKPKKLKMLDWHLVNLYLTIWIQRNWSDEEIINKYTELNTQ